MYTFVQKLLTFLEDFTILSQNEVFLSQNEVLLAMYVMADQSHVLLNLCEPYMVSVFRVGVCVPKMVTKYTPLM